MDNVLPHQLEHR